MRVISSMATRHLLAELLPEHELVSLGGVDAEKRVADGEQWDLVALASGALARLAAVGRVDAAVPFVLSQTAVAVPDAAVTAAEPPVGPAYPSAVEVQEALRAAGRIGYSTGPSGTALVGMIDAWGITSDVGALVQARAGVPVAASLAAGEVDLGFQQLSELVGQPGIRILGVLPEDCAIDTVFSVSVASTASAPTDARDLVSFLTSPEAEGIIRSHHFGVPPR